jgi:hypothetical protein
MSPITWADVVAIAPELAALSLTAQEMILAYVNTVLAVDLLDGESGPKTRLARVLLAAHLGTLFSRGAQGSVGPVVEESLGPQSKKYANLVSEVSGDLGATPYGMAYRAVIRASLARGPHLI